MLVGAGEGPKPPTQANTGNEQAEIAKRLGEVSATLKGAQETDQTTQPCDPKKPNRNSDLCAQWKAADAAANAANAAWEQIRIGWIGIALGSITMFAAIAAAFYAREAAKHTETNATSFVEAERAILHAVGGDVGKSSVDQTPCVAINFINRGRTPARIIEIGSKGRDGTPKETSARRWTTIAPDQNAMVAAFAPPDFDEKLNIDCWIRYKTLGPKTHVSYFTVSIYWLEDDSPDFTIMPHWVVSVSNPNGHPDDT